MHVSRDPCVQAAVLVPKIFFSVLAVWMHESRMACECMHSENRHSVVKHFRIEICVSDFYETRIGAKKVQKLHPLAFVYYWSFGTDNCQKQG